MRPLTENKKRQWLWFAMLWCGGLVATLVLSYGFKWIVSHLSP
jgi:hypothetical protein